MLNIDSQPYRCADGNIVQFWEKPIQNKVASAANGRPIFYKALMARITSPAMKTQAPDQQIYLKDENGQIIRKAIRYTNADTGIPETWEDFFKPQLEAYHSSQSGNGSGTPLDTYPKLDVAQIAMLKVLGIHFLEQLCAVPDSQLGQLGHGGRAMRDGAKAYVEAAQGNAPMEKLNAKNAELEEQLAAMRAQLEQLAAHQDEPKRRGRPPKTAEAA